jgi:AraC family transcriptional regulator
MTDPGFEPEAVHVLPTLCARCELEPLGTEEIGDAMVQAMGRLAVYMAQHNLEHAGPPRSVYASYGGSKVQMTVGFPIVEPDVEPPITADVSIGEMAYGPALRFRHVGPYDSLTETYGAITDWMIENDFMESEADWAHFSPVWEEYVGDPMNTAPEELVTFIYVPAPRPEAEEE